MSSCPRCGGARYLISPQGEYARAEICECVAQCPLCRGDGYTYERDERGYQFAKPCPCRALTKNIGYFNGAKIPAVYANRTFDNFEPAKGTINNAKPHAVHFAREFKENERGLLFYGNCGTGKTHLTVAILKKLVFERAKPVRFVEFMHLLAAMKVSFGDRSKSHDLISPLVEVPILAIDELGKGRGTDWELSVLDELISKRYNASRTTLFTTNYDPWKADGEEALITHVGERILSRLKEMCRWVEMNGPDYRERLNPSPPRVQAPKRP